MSIAAPATATLLRETSSRQTDEMINESLPAVKFWASRMASRVPPHVDVDDLVQVGLIGLLQSASRFDPGRGVKFHTFANRRVQGAMLDYLRSLDWKPRSVRRRSRKLAKATHDAEQRMGARASQEDVAREAGISMPELEQWMDASASFSSLNQWEETTSEDCLPVLADPADSPEAALEKEEIRQGLIEAINHLPENERSVLSFYYYEELTMQEIGELLGLKQARISQLHNKAVGLLRRRLERNIRARRQAASPPAA